MTEDAPHATRRWRALALACVVSAAVVAAGVVVETVSARDDSGPTAAPLDPDVALPQQSVDAKLDGCVDSPTARDGRQVFRVRNTTAVPVDFELTDADGKVVGEIEALGPQSTRSLDVSVGAGRYRFVCMFDDARAVTSASFALAGESTGGPVAAPLSTQDLTPATLAYEHWVTGRLPDLVAGAQQLRDQLGSADIENARATWVSAHHLYETLGAAYGAFGDVDTAIDGTATGPDFSGFHRIEQGLWGSEPAAALLPIADRLVADTQRLQEQFTSTHVDPLDIGLRAHEISEDTLQFELTGRNDFGSHTGLDTVAANLDGTRELLDVLRPLLTPRYSALAEVDSEIAKTRDLVVSLDAKYLRSVAIPAVAPIDRQRVDGAVSHIAELLAPVAALCDVRRTG
ncbi:EfeM/EfeO family lipoprotein [Antrihabitans cavernicola]|uniref:EfeM/EfeO family lipoprotein n=1 Tax=Antrihabitans cavernicola TaxID=2495913 RepID=A0A5A7SET5_9NOCA|nr:EfeM/EfeO family lipoprotein [Spelaeibacter cavernicola]KAA0023939.1 EfeM/EfeO family lipoprotein [Spelaeibacter cavernicola]